VYARMPLVFDKPEEVPTVPLRKARIV